MDLDAVLRNHSNDASASIKKGGNIQRLDRKVGQRVCASQVVVDLRSVCKELIENSLDASSTSIKVSFAGNGFESITVSDNGTGITPQFHELLCRRHTTSKIENADDIVHAASFGFRGEALHSLCSFADLVVTTSSTENGVGHRIVYDSDGVLVESTETARTRGTTVTVSNLFRPFPVRLRALQKRAGVEFNRAVLAIQEYALVAPSVAFSVSTMKNSRPTVVFATSLGSTLTQSVGRIFGGSLLKTLVPIDTGTVSGFISGASYGRNTADRQFISINNRPVDVPELSGALNNAFRAVSHYRFPCIFITVKVAPDAIDVNVTPDKRTVLLRDRQTVVGQVVAAAGAVWGVAGEAPVVGGKRARGEGAVVLGPGQESVEEEGEVGDVDESEDGESVEAEATNDNSSVAQQPIAHESSDSSDSEPDSPGSLVDFVEECEAAAEAEYQPNARESTDDDDLGDEGVQEREEIDPISLPVDPRPLTQPALIHAIPNTVDVGKRVARRPTNVVVRSTSNCDNADDDVSDSGCAGSEPSVVIDQASAEIGLDTEMDLHIDPNLIDLDLVVPDAIDHTTISEEIQFTRSDLDNLTVIGQFNNGFILCQTRIEGSTRRNIFIIDQHAAEEAYNYEQLMTRRSGRQALVQPRVVDGLSSGQIAIVQEHDELFRNAGFDYDVVIQDGREVMRLLAVPTVQGKPLGAEDIEEMIAKIPDALVSQAGPQKLHDFIAMRACKMSIKMGDELKEGQLRRVLGHMKAAQRPWFCPHGRPTIKCLGGFE
ncbi:DNA mismatch repair protein family PMS1 (MLH2) [Carpediemonas membranifera]|uniref:DNA mismatch repair protein family PMS1 (MLH2) n=1 Tax=Carpediemonas membranifera TaxID=201153 RepID=A0A8J6B194_9EUKA|nr:DNA mismatch repair protein family PMS1 (MLH2) [Carpediemonas membranifera]|eukprot:KAG9397145.1 DNA mismatch repair protein family PMS1 (MLH2) [Carpediemonas membranifera]